jgi:FkbM family methyltransferase
VIRRLGERAERNLEHLLQRMLGFHRYLVLFSRFKRLTLRWDRYERDVLALADRLAADAVVLDVGANVGIMTSVFAKRVPHGHVFAFEPIPENVAALRSACARWIPERVTVHPVAVGAEPGELRMVMPLQDHVRMQGLAHVVDSDARTVDGEYYTVPEVRLDDLLELQDLEVAAIKVDVENFEEQVFRGALALLERCRPIVYTELWDNDVRSRCFALFDQLRYDVRVHEDGDLVPYDAARHHHHNFFMVPRR